MEGPSVNQVRVYRSWSTRESAQTSKYRTPAAKHIYGISWCPKLKYRWVQTKGVNQAQGVVLYVGVAVLAALHWVWAHKTPDSVVVITGYGIVQARFRVTLIASKSVIHRAGIRKP